MKKITVLFLMIFVMAKINAQNYFIRFSGVIDSFLLDSVQVKNITLGTKLSLLWSDTLHLVGNSSINSLNENIETAIVYPSPMQGSAELSFYAKLPGNTNILIYDISGKKVIQISNKIPQGINKYEITGLKEGMFFINIIGDNYRYNVKLICENSFQNNLSIKYIGNENNVIKQLKLNSKESTSLVDMDFVYGNSLSFTGYAGSYKTNVFVAPDDNNSWSSYTIWVPTKSTIILFGFTTLPKLTTTDVSYITTSSVTTGGNITSDGGSTITDRGVCYGTSSNPDLNGMYAYNGNGTGSYIINLIGLNPNTKYYIRAYATNSNGTAYGNQVSFTTLCTSISTTSATGITGYTAVSGGNITSYCKMPIIAKGVCYSTLSYPDTNKWYKHTIDGSGTNSFISYITGLSPNTTYYVCAYAIDSLGVAYYGNQLSFVTTPPGGLVVGQKYQGGIIAYIYQPGDTGYVQGEIHGIIAAPSDQSTGIIWQLPDPNSGNYWGCGTVSDIGFGKANTNNIVSSNGVGYNYAALLCYNLILGGYSDWYLPSFDELQQIMYNQNSIGGFQNGWYWSSSEVYDNSGMFAYDVSLGPKMSCLIRDNYASVRAVRSF